MIKYIFCPIFLHNCTTCNIVTCNSLFQHNDCSLPIDFLQDLEDLDEEVDDVQVELDGGQDVLLGAESGHDHLSVHDDEQREEEGAAHSQGGVSELITHKHLEEAAEDEDQESGGEGGVQAREVPLGLNTNIEWNNERGLKRESFRKQLTNLECKCSESNNYGGSQEEGLDDDALVEEGD